MIIYSPSQVQMGNEMRISARIEFHIHRKGFPSELWYRFPSNTGLQISLDPDPFAVSLLLLAMQLNEPLEVRGSLSCKLLEGLNEYQRIYHSWFPQRFHVIKIEPTSLRNDSISPKTNGFGCAFSGGVDSFYTLLTLLGRSSEHSIRPLFMGGFDMPLNLTKSINELTTSYAEMMKTMGIHFIVGSTNVRNFVNSVDWTNAHGQALAAAALFFKNEWQQFFIPSSYTHTHHPKWGTHPSLDPLLSTKSLEMIHHGANANRVSKLKLITQAQESYSRLRVCWIQDIGLKNCGQCEKCIRTMIALEILGVLSSYTTFDRQALNQNKIRTLSQRTYQSRLFAKELIWEAFQRRKFKICFDLAYSLLRRRLFYRKSIRTRLKES